MVNNFSASSKAQFGNTTIDSISCNAVGIGATRSSDPGTGDPSSRLVICRQSTDNGDQNLVDICNESGTTQIYVDKDFNMLATTGYLGISTNRWSNIYGNTVNCTALSVGSDSRIKDNIVTADNTECMERVRNIRLAQYSYASGTDSQILWGENTIVRGVIAQEIKTVLPHSVKIGKGIIENGVEVDDFHYLQKNFIIMELLGAVKHLDTLVTTQSAEISSLKSRIEVLEG